MAIFNSFLYVYQRVMGMWWGFNHRWLRTVIRGAT